jgi:hypothetical protein
MVTGNGAQLSRCCMASIVAISVCLASTAPAQANSKKAIGTAIGIGAGLLLLNEAAKAMQSENKRPPRPQQREEYTPRQSRNESEPKEPRKTRSAKPKQEEPTQQAVAPEATKTPEPSKDYGFSAKPRETIYALPDKPSQWAGPAGASVLSPGASMVGRELGLAQRVAAFGGSPAAAASMFVELMKARPNGAAPLQDQDVRALAGSAFDGEVELVQLVNRGQASGLALKDERVQALIIGQAWRILDEQPVAAATEAGAGQAKVTAAFQQAARDVLVQSQATYEAVRLTRSGETLVGAINDVIARGGKQPELIAAASDRGRGLMRVLETEVPNLVLIDSNPVLETTASSFEIRRRLLDCVSLRLSSVAENAAAAAPTGLPVERASSEPGRSPEARSWLVSQIVSDAKTNCFPLLAPVKPQGPQVLPAANGLPARKASAPDTLAPSRPMLAGQIAE